MPETSSESSSILGSLTSKEFLHSYWQRQPLLVRAALPDYTSPVSPDELAGLATEEDIESRIVIEEGANGRWALQHGPFDAGTFAALPETHWTLLVQAVDLWVPECKKLLNRFDFLPPWRLDDLMVSYAPPGGSVGPHFDQYDVFLLQVEGTRRWQLGGVCDANTKLARGTELKIVDDFAVQEDWLLEPGDMLYLPPNIAHWGVAESASLTFSVGFRSPSLSDMLGDLAVELAARGGVDHYRDPPLLPRMAEEKIDPAFVAQAKQQLITLIDDDALIADWLARYMTAPKYPELVDSTAESRTASVALQRYYNGEPEQ